MKLATPLSSIISPRALLLPAAATFAFSSMAFGQAAPTLNLMQWFKDPNTTYSAGTWLDSATSDGIQNATQGNAGKQPILGLAAINGKPVVRFDGADDNLFFARTISDDFSIFAVYRGAGVGTQADQGQWWGHSGIVDGEVGGAQQDFGTSIDANGRLYAGIGSNDTTISAQPANPTQAHLLEFQRVALSGTMTLYVDGVQVAQNIAGPTGSKNTPGTLSLGSLQTNGNFFTGDIGEVLTYSSADAATRLGAEQYLLTKFAIPEPGTVSILGLGMAGLLLRRRRG